jgi:hypothetical protein
VKTFTNWSSVCVWPPPFRARAVHARGRLALYRASLPVALRPTAPRMLQWPAGHHTRRSGYGETWRGGQSATPPGEGLTPVSCPMGEGRKRSHHPTGGLRDRLPALARPAAEVAPRGWRPSYSGSCHAVSSLDMAAPVPSFPPPVGSASGRVGAPWTSGLEGRCQGAPAADSTRRPLPCASGCPDRSSASSPTRWE